MTPNPDDADAGVRESPGADANGTDVTGADLPGESEPDVSVSAACALIRVKDSDGPAGTAYLIDSTTAVTCAHVVENGPVGKEVVLEFEGETIAGKVSGVDPRADAALIELARPRTRAKPLVLAGTPPKDMIAWSGAGFLAPSANGEPAVSVRTQGLIASPTARDAVGTPLISLAAPDLASKMTAQGDAAGAALAGSPVLVDGLVVGHVRGPLPHPDTLERPFALLAEATRADQVAGLRGGEAWTAPEFEAAHVMISFREVDRKKVDLIKGPLEHIGFRVLHKSHEEVAGTALSKQERRGVETCRAAVLLFSVAWKAKDALEEVRPILERARSDPSFRVFVVRLDEFAVPPELKELALRTWKQKAKAENILESLKRDLVGASESNEGPVWDAVASATADFDADLRAAKKNPALVRDLAFRWHEAGMPGSRPLENAADALIKQARHDLALQVLDLTPVSVGVLRKRGLALGKMGRYRDAIDVLERARSDGQMDPKSTTGLASRYKDEWVASGQVRRGLLRRAYDLYNESQALNAEHSTAVNLATVALLLDRAEEARQHAEEVLRIVAEERARGTPAWNEQWLWASQGEAHLHLGQWDAAIDSYERSVAGDLFNNGNLATKRKQARLLLSKLKQVLPEAAADLDRVAGVLEQVLHIPGVAAFSGHRFDASDRAEARFPVHRERYVRRRVREALAKHHIGIGICSLADGGDLIFAEEILRRGGTLEVVLPFPRDVYRGISVASAFHARFDAILDTTDGVELVILDEETLGERGESRDDANAFALCADVIIDRALGRARAHEASPTLLSVWNGERVGITAYAVQAWYDEGLGSALVTIDPLSDDSSPPPPGGTSAGGASATGTGAGSDAGTGTDAGEGGEAAGGDQADQPAATERLVPPRQRGMQPLGAEPEGAGFGPVTYKNKHLLAVGVDAYLHWRPLLNAVHDAQGFAELLSSSFGFQTRILTNAEGTSSGIRSAIEDLKDVGPDDLLVIFFAGHGHTERTVSGGNRGFLVPVDARKGRMADLIPMPEVLSWTEFIEARHILYVFDSCFSGTAAVGGGGGSPQEGACRYAITAGAPNQVVADGGPEWKNHSVFTGRLLRGLETELPSPVNVLNLAAYLQEHVPFDARRAGSSRQTPSLGALPGHDGGGTSIYLGPES